MRTKDLLVTNNKWSLKALWFRLKGGAVKTGSELWNDSKGVTVAGKVGSKTLKIIEK